MVDEVADFMEGDRYGYESGLAGAGNPSIHCAVATVASTRQRDVVQQYWGASNLLRYDVIAVLPNGCQAKSRLMNMEIVVLPGQVDQDPAFTNGRIVCA